MKRLMFVLTVAMIIAAMFVASAAPALASSQHACQGNSCNANVDIKGDGNSGLASTSNTIQQALAT
jgi:uncharacterized protein YdeI (BOF family)